MIAVAIGSRELKTGVVHRGGIHGDGGIGNAGLFGNGHGIQQVIADVFVPFGSEFQTVVEHGKVNTYVVAFLLFPRQVVVHESRDGRTGDRGVAKAVSHVVTRHYSLIHVFTDIFITQFTVTSTHFEHIYHVAVEGKECLLVEAPAHGHGGECTPADILGQTGTAVAADGCRNQVSVIEIVVDTANV